jgi:hypothetical protein
MERYETYVALPNSTQDAAKSLRDRRIRLGCDETSRPPIGTVNQLKALFNDYDTFLDNLKKDFGGISEQRRQEIEDKRLKIEKLRNWKALSISFIVGIITSLLGTALWEWRRVLYESARVLWF